MLACALLFGFSHITHGQKRTHRRYNTQQVLKEAKKQYPEYTARLDSLERDIAALLVSDQDKAIQIPVVFHLMSGDGKTPNAEQVKKQLAILNAHFGTYTGKNTGKLPPNAIVAQYAHFGSNLGISFYIPQKVQDIEGVHIVKTDIKQWSPDGQLQDPKRGGVAPVDPEHVINIWVGELGKFNAGYAHLPGAPLHIDGIVIDPDYFGTNNGAAQAPYNGGKTLVHLMGSYLGLYELWNNYNPCEDDRVADTPIHNAPTESISSEKNARYITLCNGMVHAMYMNFMDNTDDELLTLFTPGQKSRMRAVLALPNGRSGLVKK